MQQNTYYSFEILSELMSQASLNIDKKDLQALQQRKPIRESYMQYKIQDDIIREQYQQSHQYQEKILSTFKALQSMENPITTSQFLLNQFNDEDMIIQNTTEQCISWYYRTQNQQYIQILILLYENYPEIQDSIEKKIIKDIKIHHQQIYKVLKQLKSILQENFLKMIYQILLIQYCFCYVYDFKNSQDTIKSIYDLIDFQQQKIESPFMLQVYQNETIIMKEILNLSTQQIYEGLIYTTQYLLPKLEFNVMFQNRSEYNFNVQEIDKQQNLKQEIQYAIDHISNDNMIEAFLPIIILNQNDMVKFILTQLIDKLIKNKNNQKILQLIINLVACADLKQLYYQNNKKKPLMREILSQVQEEYFSLVQNVDNNSLFIMTSLCNFYKNGLLSKPQLLIYTKLIIKTLLTLFIDQKIIIKDNVLFHSLEEIKKQVECTNKAKDHEKQLLKEVFQKIISIQKLNWFDLENLIKFDTLCEILELMQDKLQQ